MEESDSGQEAQPAVVLPVQDLVSGHGAACSDDVPTQFVARAHDDNNNVPAPVIDLGRLCRRDGAGADEADKLRMALESWGLFLVANHGIEASLMDGMMDASREFFRQPPEVKQKHSSMVDGKRFEQGYGNDLARSEHHVLDWNYRLLDK